MVTLGVCAAAFVVRCTACAVVVVIVIQSSRALCRALPRLSYVSYMNAQVIIKCSQYHKLGSFFMGLSDSQQRVACCSSSSASVQGEDDIRNVYGPHIIGLAEKNLHTQKAFARKSKLALIDPSEVLL